MVELYSMKESTKFGWIKSVAFNWYKILVNSWESSKLAWSLLRTAKHDTKTASEWFRSDGFLHNSTNRSTPLRRTKSRHTLVELQSLKIIKHKIKRYFQKLQKPVFYKFELEFQLCTKYAWNLPIQVFLLIWLYI